MTSTLDGDLYPGNLLERMGAVEHATRFLLERSGISAGSSSAEAPGNVYRVTAGQGLVGGGVGNVTVHVGQGQGITVTEDAVSVDLLGLADDLHGIEVQDGKFRIKVGARGQLSFDGAGGLILHDNLPGTGLAYDGSWKLIHGTGNFGDLHTNYAEHAAAETISGAWAHTAALTLRGVALNLRTAGGAGTAALQPNGDGTIAVVEGSGLHPAADGTLDLGAASARWGETHLGDLRSYNAAGTKNVLLRHDDAQAELVASDGALRLESLASDVILSAGGKDVLPLNNYDLNLGLINRKWLTLHAAELWVETLVAQDTIATIGGRILVGPTTMLAADVGTGDTTIEVKHNQMSSGDRVYLEADGQVEFMAITSAPSGTGPYTYSVTRNLDGSGANEWYAGDAVFNTGQAGKGFIDIYSVSGIKSGAGPTIVGNVRNSATYNDWTEHWAIGNLNGVYGYGADTYGVGVGKRTANHIVIDESNGIRFRNNTTVLAQLSASTWTLGQAGEARVEITNTQVTLYDGAATPQARVVLDSSGNVTVGRAGNARTVINDSGVAIYDTSSTQRVSLSSLFWIGKTSGTERMQWDATNGLRIFNASNQSVIRMPASGTALINGTLSVTGQITAGAGVVTINPDGIRITPTTSYPGASSPRVLAFGTSSFIEAISSSSQKAMRMKSIPGAASSPAATVECRLVEATQVAEVNVNANDINLNADFLALSAITTFGNYVNSDIRMTGGITVGTSTDLAGNGQVTYTGNLISRKGSTSYNVYAYEPKQFAVVHYNGTSLGAGTHTVTAANMGYATGIAKAVYVRVFYVSATAGAVFNVQPLGGFSQLAGVVPTSNGRADGAGIVHCDSSGRISISISHAGTVTLAVYGAFL